MQARTCEYDENSGHGREAIERRQLAGNEWSEDFGTQAQRENARAALQDVVAVAEIVVREPGPGVDERNGVLAGETPGKLLDPGQGDIRVPAAKPARLGHEDEDGGDALAATQLEHVAQRLHRAVE